MLLASHFLFWIYPLGSTPPPVISSHASNGQQTWNICAKLLWRTFYDPNLFVYLFPWKGSMSIVRGSGRTPTSSQHRLGGWCLPNPGTSDIFLLSSRQLWVLLVHILSHLIPHEALKSLGHTRLVKKRRSKSLHGSSMVDMILSENMVHFEISFSLRLHFWGRAPFSETPIKIQEVGLVLLAALSWCKIQNWT